MIPLDDLPDDILARVMSDRLRNMAVSRRFASIVPKPQVWVELQKPWQVTELAHTLRMGLVDVVGITVLRKETEDSTLERSFRRDRALLGKLMCLPQCRALRTFKINNWFSSKLEKLEKISVGEEGATLLAPALRQCPLLEELILSKCYIENNGVFSLATAISNMTELRKLDLGANNISDDGLKSLVRSLSQCKKLELLDLGCNEISDEGVIGLSTLLPRWPSLKVLYLGENRIGGEGVRRLAAVLPRCPLLEDLSLSSLNLYKFPGGIEPLAEVLPFCPMLRHLDINESCLNLQSTMALAKAIPHCVNLEELYMATCEIEQNSVEALADAFVSAERLQYVRMQRNDFRDSELLSEINETHPSIWIELEDSDNEIESEDSDNDIELEDSDNESDNISYGHSDSEYSDSDDGG